MPVFRSGVVLILAGVACKRSKPYRIDYDSIKSEWLQDILLSGRKDISAAVVGFLITKFHANFILNKCGTCSKPNGIPGRTGPVSN